MVLPNSKARNDVRPRQRPKNCCIPGCDRGCVLWACVGLVVLGIQASWLDYENYGASLQSSSFAAGTAAQETLQSLFDTTNGAPNSAAGDVATTAATTVRSSPERISPDDLQELIDDLRGDDHRLVRWDATKRTRKKQRKGGCDKLPQAVQVLTDAASPASHRGLACEFLTFCLTDNPKMRVVFSETNPGIYEAVVDLVRSTDDPHASAMAGHLIYIAVFANPENHQGFIRASAVQHLGDVVKDHASDRRTKVQVMWAAAALQNLAASYCETEDNGRCYWKWNKKNLDRPELVIRGSSQPLQSDGTRARQEILNDEALLRALMELVCKGPVNGKKSSDNPYPGHNAKAGRDDQSPGVVPWAAAGVLKNAALEPTPAFLELLDPAMPCFCRMKRSEDWLEENKAGAVLDHTRRKDPCWFDDDDTNKDGSNDDKSLCVDRYFVDESGYDCSGYENASKQECSGSDATGTTTANSACCPCGGGTRERRATQNRVGRD